MLMKIAYVGPRPLIFLSLLQYFHEYKLILIVRRIKLQKTHLEEACVRDSAPA